MIPYIHYKYAKSEVNMPDSGILCCIDRWIEEHLSQIIDDLRGLVRIPSVSIPDKNVPPFGQACRDALSYMYRLAEKHGYSTRDFEHYVGAADFSEGDISIGIWSHLDVVPVGDPAEWLFPPFECTLAEDRYLIGRGVQDNKMTAIAVLHVMNCLRDMGVRLRHGYSLYMGTAEETGMEDCRYFVSHHPCPDISLVPDTGFPVCIGQRGCLRFHISIPFEHDVHIREFNDPSVTPNVIEAVTEDGTVLHAEGEGGFVYQSVGKTNAIHVLLEQLSVLYPGDAVNLKALKSITSGIDGASLGMAYTDRISGPLHTAPTTVEVISGRLSIHMYTVLPVTASADLLMKKANERASVIGASIECISLRKACYYPEEHPVISALTEVYHNVTGFDAKPFVMTGGNYAAVLPNAFGCGPGMPGRQFPGHIFKPGHGNYHQCDESEDIEHIKSFMRVYAMMILTLDKMDPSLLISGKK